MDKLHKKQRSWNMSRIKSKNTKPEIDVKKYLYGKGVRYRSSKKKLIGNPDLVIRKYKLVLFVHGCFWHAHQNCKAFRYPKSNIQFWKNKIDKNVSRDNYVTKKLTELSYRVYVIWECEIKKQKFTILNKFIDDYFRSKSKYISKNGN